MRTLHCGNNISNHHQKDEKKKWEEGGWWCAPPPLSSQSQQNRTRGNSHRDMYQLHPGWMARAQDGLPWQGRWHALLCRHLSSQGMFAHYFIAWSCLVGAREKRPASVYRIWVAFLLSVVLWLMVASVKDISLMSLQPCEEISCCCLRGVYCLLITSVLISFFLCYVQY